MLTKDDLGQIKILIQETVQPMLSTALEAQRADIMRDTRALLEQELRPIRDELASIKEKLEQLEKREDEDTLMMFREVELLKKKIKRLESRIAMLEK